MARFDPVRGIRRILSWQQIVEIVVTTGTPIVHVPNRHEHAPGATTQ